MASKSESEDVTVRENMIEIFEDELAIAANNLEIEEGEDDQEALRMMILSLQQAAYERGLIDGNTNNLRDSLGEEAVVAEVRADQVSEMMSSLPTRVRTWG